MKVIFITIISFMLVALSALAIEKETVIEMSLEVIELKTELRIIKDQKRTEIQTTLNTKEELEPYTNTDLTEETQRAFYRADVIKWVNGKYAGQIEAINSELELLFDTYPELEKKIRLFGERKRVYEFFENTSEEETMLLAEEVCLKLEALKYKPAYAPRKNIPKE